MTTLDLHVGNPVVRGALTLFPVFRGDAVAEPGYVLHDPALTVTERAGTPVVDELVVTNTGARPGLVLAGELLTGGWQHRVAIRSVMVEPGRALVLPVRCVEQGRWAGGGAHAREGRRAPVTVRAATGQHEVWARVGGYGASPTGSLLDTVAGREAAASALVAGLRPLAFQAGVLVGIAGRPVLLEVLDAPTALAAIWDGLLRAAALDAVGAPAVPTPGARARGFARAVRRAAAGGPGPAPDLLTWRDRVVHAVAVPA
jgi:hypothetical protein